MGSQVDTQTVYHEVAHQRFYFLVGNNENDEPWLDEGFATFSANLCMEAAEDQHSSDIWWDFYQEIAERHPDYAINVSVEKMSYDYMEVCNFRGANFLKELMDTMGRKDFLAAVSEYCNTYMYKMATMQDLLDIMQAHTGSDLSVLIDEYTD